MTVANLYPEKTYDWHTFGNWPDVILYQTEWVPGEEQVYHKLGSDLVHRVLVDEGRHRHFMVHYRGYDGVIRFEYELVKPGGFRDGVLTVEEFELICRFNFRSYRYEEITDMIETAKYYNIPLDQPDQVLIAYRLNK